jgi:dienelactone hydrolase
MKVIFLTLIFFTATFAQGKVITKNIEYKDKETVLEGYLAYDDAIKGTRPGILVIHDWMGMGPYGKRRSEQLAKLGYVAFAADIYGKGVHPQSAAEAGKLASTYKNNRSLFRERALAGLAALKKQPFVDLKRLAVIGYCFGGTGALELGRAGAEVDGIVTFHGGLDNPAPEDAKNIKAKVLVLHGADDPNVPDAQVAAFEDEMRKAKVDWQLVKYSGAVHAFTNKDAGNDNSKGVAYNASADRRSWIAMQDFFREIFGH